MNTALDNIAVLQGIERKIGERQQKLADVQSKSSFKHSRQSYLKKQLKRLKFRETIRKPSEEFELWSIGVVIVGVATSILASWLLFYVLNATTLATCVCVGIFSAIVTIVLGRLMFVPSIAELSRRINGTEQALTSCKSELRTLEEQELTLKNEISKFEADKRQIRSSQKYNAELLLTRNWKAMRDQQWEQFLAEIFILMGGQVTKTGATGDQGVDLVVEFAGIRTAIQAKGYFNSVGNAAVQQAVAGKAMYKCSRCAVITNSRFTKSAQQLAASNGCMLFDEGRIRPLALGEVTFLFSK